MSSMIVCKVCGHRGCWEFVRYDENGDEVLACCGCGAETTSKKS